MSTMRGEVQPVALSYDLAWVNDSTITITGHSSRAGVSTLVHLWDPRRHRIRRSFFRTPAHDPKLGPVYRFSSAVDVAARSDTLALTFALSDTLYLFTTSGNVLTKLPIPFEYFRRVTRPPSLDLSPESRARWTESFSRVSHVFWANDGSFYVQYFDINRAEPQWRLVRMR